MTSHASMPLSFYCLPGLRWSTTLNIGIAQTDVRLGALEDNLEKLHSMAKALMKYETIDEQQIKDIMAGREPRPPEDWDDSTGSSSQDDSPAPKAEEVGGKIGGPAPEH